VENKLYLGEIVHTHTKHMQSKKKKRKEGPSGQFADQSETNQRKKDPTKLCKVH